MITVKLSPAAHALLETDREDMNADRRITVNGLYVQGDRAALLALSETFGEWLAGWRDADNPGAAKRTAVAAQKAIRDAIDRG